MRAYLIWQLDMKRSMPQNIYILFYGDIDHDFQPITMLKYTSYVTGVIS